MQDLDSRVRAAQERAAAFGYDFSKLGKRAAAALAMIGSDAVFDVACEVVVENPGVLVAEIQDMVKMILQVGSNETAQMAIIEGYRKELKRRGEAMKCRFGEV